MNRIIKFRAWDRKRKELFPVHELEWHKISHSLTECVGYDDWDEDGYTKHGGGIMTYANGERYVLQQYTGLKDKNGKEIYEGDVVKWIDTYSDNLEFVGSVDFRGGSFCIVGKGVVGFRWYDYTTEVLGNIHEHPHLLEAEA